MVQRVAYGVISIIVIVTIVVADVLLATTYPENTFLGNLFQYGSLLPATFTLLALIGARELHHLLRIGGKRPHALLAYATIALLMLSPWFSAAGLLGQRADRIEGMWWQLVWLGGGMIATMFLQVLRRNPQDAFRDMGATWLMIVYLGLLPSFANQIRCGRYIPGQEGAWAILIIILVTKFSDIGGYLVGSTMGRHKLIPSVSAGKSVEGTLGGIAASVLLAVAFVAAGDLLPSADSILAAGSGSGAASLILEISEIPRQLGYIGASVFAVLLALSGLLGDLFESCLKRAASRKDSAAIIPEYGGILDLTDSPWTAMPVAWFLLTEVWGVL